MNCSSFKDKHFVAMDQIEQNDAINTGLINLNIIYHAFYKIFISKISSISILS